MALIRGGRVVIDDLRASIAAIRAYRLEAAEAIIRNPRKAELALQDIELIEREIERLIADVLEPMLKKRDVRAERDLADVAERLGQIEARLAILERGDQRLPIPLRRQERG